MASFDPRRWLDEPPVLDTLGNRFTIVRDDLLEGGTKLRFLPFLTHGAKEIVFGGPFCGGAPLALSVLGKHSGQRVTIFYAKRSQLHPRQTAVLRNGATVYQVPYGYMSNVQAKAKAYAKKADAMFLPLGFDLPEAVEPFKEAIARVRKKVGNPDEVWCATGSGMLARCLGEGFPNSAVHGVVVGLVSRNERQSFGKNVTLHQAPYDFAKPGRQKPPFSSCANYDAKAWELCFRMSTGSTLFWNVMGEAH